MGQISRNIGLLIFWAILLSANYFFTSLATVSVFGTIKGISVGELVIKGVYKYNTDYTASITIQILQ